MTGKVEIIMEVGKKTIDVEKNKQEFCNLVKSQIGRDGVDNLLNFLLKSDFFVAPSSTRFHLSCDGGLCQHSLNVYRRLIREVECEYGSLKNSPYSIETLTIVSLMHDLCKIDFYKKDVSNKKIDGQWVPVTYYKIEDKLPIEHGFKSQYILRSYINLSREESVAIMSHMGGFDTTVKGGSYAISNAFGEFPLAVLLHVADLKASNIDESKE